MGDIISVTGIILSTMPVGDYDKRVVLLTRERGKISAFAKGARRMNSPLMGVTNPFSFGTFKLYEGRSSYNIQGGEIDNYFQEIVTDINCVYYGIYFMELADYYTYENMNAMEELNLLYITLKALKKDSIPNELIRYIYELKFMVIHGSYPSCFECGLCKKEEELIYFSAAKGSVLCKECGKKELDAITIMNSTLYTMQYIISTPVNKLFMFTVNNDVLNELRVIMERLRLLTIDKELKSLDMLELMKI